MATPTAEPTLARRAVVHRTLLVEARGAPDVLIRVLTTLRRRGCAVTHVDYAVPDRHYPGRLEIGIDAPAGRAHCVDRWVSNLVDVLSVRARETQSAAAEPARWQAAETTHG